MADAEALRKQRQQQLEEKRKRLEDLRRRRQDKAPGEAAPTDAPKAVDASAIAPDASQAQQDDDFEALIKGLLGTPAPAPAVPPAPSVAVTSEAPVSHEEEPQPSQLPVVRGIAVRHVMPVAREVYDKGIQTDESEESHTESEASRSAPVVSNAVDEPESESKELLRVKSQQEGEAMRQQVVQDAKERLLTSDSFSKFLKRSGTVVERALTEQATFDILNYSKGAAPERTHGSDQLHKLLRFYDPTWCGDRAVTDVHWSPHYPELLLVSYSASGRGQNSESALLGAPAPGDAHPDGLVLVWSLALPSRPEFILYSQSPILTARFHEFDAHLVVGGSYSGQVVTWDVRATSLPVQQTPVSDAAHTRPIFGMAMEGTGAAHALVTASTDGRVAWWNPRQLLQPNEVLQLALAQSDNDASGGGLSVSCIACVPGETVQLLVGMDSGRILAVAVHTHSAGVQREFHGHFGMVTALDTNPSKAKALQELVLSSSMDWTTRLWSLRQSDKPLVTFSHDSYDYVCDVRWSPVHPALFATANVAGDLTLWNVTASLDTPVTPPCKVSGNALTKLAWSREGCRLAAGDVTGAVHVYAIAEDMALPRHDEEHRLERLLHELTS